MKAVFVGPSLSGVTKIASGCTFFPPAAQGDLMRVVLDGATVIGLIDGLYETVAAVWHKEILFALQRGVRVLGAASMGALRAAECQCFGMEVVGGIAERYASGLLDDDAAVAVVHAPAELDYAPLSVALVDFDATVEELWRLNLISAAEATVLSHTAARTFFKERTVAGTIARAIVDPKRAANIVAVYLAHSVSLKRRDALLLVEQIAMATQPETQATRLWVLSEPPAWHAALHDVAGVRGASPQTLLNQEPMRRTQESTKWE